MNYYINIIDTENSNYTTQLEHASADSIKLKWKGADAIDELVIVGSLLSFNMEVPFNNNVDAAFIDLFTGDEQRYKVELRRETDDFLIWQGFLLPDSYNEPYTNGTFYVDFEAVDGLGRLKGKYLPDDYYTTEKSVVDIVCKCLELTGLQMDLIFAPGIDNKVQKDWSQIYLDGSIFTSNDKQNDAYKILETIVSDTISCVYQKLGVWYVEGLNKRNLLSYEAYKYDYQGQFINLENVVKVVRTVTGKVLQTPNIEIITPYKTVSVTHEREALGFKSTVTKEKNDGWVFLLNESGVIHATDWFGTSTFDMQAKIPDYRVYILTNGIGGFTYNKYVGLKSKIYLKKNQKIKFNLQLSIHYYGTENSEDIDDLISNGTWTNFLKYELSVADQILFSNTQTSSSVLESVSFKKDKKAELSFEFLVLQNGLFNVRFYQPALNVGVTKVRGVFIDAMTIEDIEHQEEILVEDTIDSDYTLVKDLELTLADDASCISNAFRLAKISQINNSIYNEITIPIVYGFTQSGNYYAQVDLYGANLVKDNLQSVYYNGALLTDLEVFYNYQNGEQMVVKTPSSITSGVFVVRIYSLIDYTLDRLFWEQWTDSVYQIESKRYCNAVVGVYRRLFSDVSQKIDLTVEKTPVMFGDLINWNYIEEKNYTVLDTEINFDSGDSSIRIQNATYLIDVGNVPPIVEAQEVVYLYDDDSVVELISTAYDPDGTVVSYLWEQITGPTSGVSIATATTSNTYVSGLTEDFYQFQITVTDNDGLTAAFVVDVVRVLQYDFGWEYISYSEVDIVDTSSGWNVLDKQQTEVLKLIVDPDLPANESVTLSCVSDLQSITTPGVQGSAALKIYKNGILIIDYSVEASESETQTFSFNFISTDEVLVELNVTLYQSLAPIWFDGYSKSQFGVTSVSFFNYLASATGIPLAAARYIEMPENT